MSETQPPPPGPDAITLAALFQLMLDAADHWVDLNRPEIAIACHQAAAGYAQACAAAWVNYQPLPPADPLVMKPLWIRRNDEAQARRANVDSGKVKLGAGMMHY